MERRKIILIENQILQHRAILNQLESYDVYPTENDFKEFIDWVRISLNQRYLQERRDRYLENIVNKINEINPELIIIDHILVGCHDAENGIDLAIKFRKKNIKQPILFLSRTEVNDIDVCEKFPKVDSEKDWVNKGYLGQRILEKDYFKSEIYPRIDKLLGESITQKTKKVLDNYIHFFNLKVEEEKQSYNPKDTRQLERLIEVLSSFQYSVHILTSEMEASLNKIKYQIEHIKNYNEECNKLINLISTL